MKNIFKTLFRRANGDKVEEKTDDKPLSTILPQVHREQYDHDMSLLEDEAGVRGDRLQKEAEKEVRSAAEESLRKLHIVQLGHCPKCGETLRKYLFASVCETCGWNSFDVPRGGPIRVHLTKSPDVIEGDRCHVITGGGVLVLRKDVVVARVPADSVSWIEYVWTDDEVGQRHKQVLDQLSIRCGWCDKNTDPEEDGFHLVHVAFGSNQTRFCFCSDECYEAFRKMYPARVHRNCYERDCDGCDLCVKRYGDEADGIRMLAKDYLKLKPEKKTKT